MTQRFLGIFLAVSVSTLVACGGGGGDGIEAVPPAIVGPTTEVPGGGPAVEPPAPVSGITELFTEAQFAAIESLGLIVNPGNTPPSIEGTFRFDPRMLQASSEPGNVDNVGNILGSQTLTFSNQNNTTLTLDLLVEEDGVAQERFGEIVFTGTSISGSGNAFTAAFVSQVTFAEQTFEVANIFSGIVTAAGIENILQVNFLLDDGGDPGDFLSPTGTGDTYIDPDGFSERLDTSDSVGSPSTGGLLTVAQLASIQSLGLQINSGDTPPNVEGTFRLDPRVLQASSQPGDEVDAGSIAASQDITFLNQDNSAQTVSFAVDDIPTTSDVAPPTTEDESIDEVLSFESFISGSGDAFTVYFVFEFVFNGQTIETVEAYSGTVADDGIENFQSVLVLLDDGGDANDSLFPIGTGNLFTDQDGFSERLEPVAVFDGSPASLSTLYTESQIAALEALGIQLNFGDSPPDVDGIFRMDPLALQATLDPNDSLGIGDVLTPLNVIVSNQNNSSLTNQLSVIIDASTVDIDVQSSFISGSGNAFTIFSLAVVTTDDSTFETREVFSGNVTAFGIENLQWVPLVLNDEGEAISGVGRLFADSDGLSESISLFAVADTSIPTTGSFLSRVVEGRGDVATGLASPYTK